MIRYCQSLISHPKCERGGGVRTGFNLCLQNVTIIWTDKCVVCDGPILQAHVSELRAHRALQHCGACFDAPCDHPHGYECSLPHGPPTSQSHFASLFLEHGRVWSRVQPTELPPADGAKQHHHPAQHAPIHLGWSPHILSVHIRHLQQLEEFLFGFLHPSLLKSGTDS